ncbi:MAG: helix-turn-helix domain-containing protein [Candidatus Borkfalkia sp.]
MKSFGEKLKELRIEKGLSQKELADLVDTSQSAIFYWENNQQEPKISSLKKLCIFFNVSADYLIGLEEEIR